VDEFQGVLETPERVRKLRVIAARHSMPHALLFGESPSDIGSVRRASRSSSPVAARAGTVLRADGGGGRSTVRLLQPGLEHPSREFGASGSKSGGEMDWPALEEVGRFHVAAEGAQEFPGPDRAPEDAVEEQQTVAFRPHRFTTALGSVVGSMSEHLNHLCQSRTSSMIPHATYSCQSGVRGKRTDD